MRIDPKSVAFDVDGVVADTMTLFLDIARIEYNITGPRYEDISCYALNECLDIDTQVIDAIITQLLDGNHRPTLSPIPGAAETLARLAGKHRPILFVTARPYVGPIAEWMAEALSLNSDSAELIASGSSEAKPDILLSRGISCFVEDRLDTCFRLSDVGITPILFRQPWNREDHPFTEVGNWAELASLMDF